MPCHQNVAHFLLDHKQEDKVALELLSGSHTYAELRATAQSVANYLHSIEGKKGDRVLLLSENSFFWVAGYLGTLLAGLVSVPLPKEISPQDLEYIVATTEARIAFVQSKLSLEHQFANMHVITDGNLSVPNTASLMAFEHLQQSHSTPEPPRVPIEGDDLAALMFTSGSTGRPRGVMISHANVIANTESIIHYLALSPDNRIMAVLPFHYCFGTSLLHTHLRVGGSVVVENRFLYPEKVLQRMIEAECTGFAGVPSHFQILLRKTSLKKKRFPHLRYIQQAGGHLASNFVRELQTTLPQTAIFIMYGQTEATARLSYLPPCFLATKPGSVGIAIPGVTLRVVNEAGVSVRPGEAGEIVAEGKNVALGYWNAPAESAAVFRNGQLHTGDLATIDEDGFIYVTDRAKDFLKCGGKRVSCREIEDRLLEFHGIMEAAVIGAPDDVLGEAVRAFVVPRSHEHNGIREQLNSFCKQHLQPNLVPREIILLRGLPKNSAGKVIKNGLRSRPVVSEV
jgi:acyl-CoA synthetase (AMP-forming)/AMP-acid ligase II